MATKGLGFQGAFKGFRIRKFVQQIDRTHVKINLKAIKNLPEAPPKESDIANTPVNQEQLWKKTRFFNFLGFSSPEKLDSASFGEQSAGE